MRKLTIKDFENSRDFEAYKRDLRKADRNKRSSEFGRRDYQFEQGSEE